MFVGIYLGSATGLIPSLILTWLLGIFCLRLSQPLTGSSHFVNWDDFRSCFRAEFFSLHLDAVATNKLEGTTKVEMTRCLPRCCIGCRDEVRMERRNLKKEEASINGDAHSLYV
jgi:hypothetical protein